VNYDYDMISVSGLVVDDYPYLYLYFCFNYYDYISVISVTPYSVFVLFHITCCYICSLSL
jgi:hypothetical protein